MNCYKSLFSGCLATDDIALDQETRSEFGSDASRDYKGEAGVVLFPRSTEQVQGIVNVCKESKIGIIPSGGLTGLCGGATALAGEVVVSLKKMSKIISIDQTECIAEVQAGVTTLALKHALLPYKLDFPISLASEGSSQIGGNIATNAGGIHFIRYGYTRNWVLGLTVVTGNGDILKTGRSLYKDNTGYDLKSLFVGSEGTLGIITEALLATTTKPESITRALCGLASVEDCMLLLNKTRSSFPSILRAFEFFSEDALTKVIKHHELRRPFSEIHPYYILIELEANDTSQTALENMLMSEIESGKVSDATIAQSSTQSEELLKYRELISETLSSRYIPHKNDISVPVSKIPIFLSELEVLMEKIAGDYQLIVFGHIGDGNLHLNWLKPEAEDREDFFINSHFVDQNVLELVSAHGGSISAEHGIGLLKRDKLHLSRSALEIEAMKGIKALFDPYGIMNPGKVF